MIKCKHLCWKFTCLEPLSTREKVFIEKIQKLSSTFFSQAIKLAVTPRTLNFEILHSDAPIQYANQCTEVYRLKIF